MVLLEDLGGTTGYLPSSLVADGRFICILMIKWGLFPGTNMREKGRTEAIIGNHGESSSSQDGLCHHQRLASSLMHIQGKHTSLFKSQLVLGLSRPQTPAWGWHRWGTNLSSGLITRPSSPSQNGHCYRRQHHQAGFPSLLGPV